MEPEDDSGRVLGISPIEHPAASLLRNDETRMRNDEEEGI